MEDLFEVLDYPTSSAGWCLKPFVLSKKLQYEDLPDVMTRARVCAAAKKWAAQKTKLENVVFVRGRLTW